MSETQVADASFKTILAQLTRTQQRLYDRSINKDLSQQKWQGLFGRNVVLIVKHSLTEIIRQTPNELLTADKLPVIENWVDELIQYAVQRHRTSCALSNFTTEHNPSQDYISATLILLEPEWQKFKHILQD